MATICTRTPASIYPEACADCHHEASLHINVKGGCLACQWEAFTAARQQDEEDLRFDRLHDEAIGLINTGRPLRPDLRNAWEDKLSDKLCAIFELGKEIGSGGITPDPSERPGQGQQVH